MVVVRGVESNRSPGAERWGFGRSQRLPDAIKPLENLTNIDILWLESNQLTGVRVLKGLDKLVVFSIKNNPIEADKCPTDRDMPKELRSACKEYQ